ncbi:MAG: CDP-glucose 4,6-dehydratase [Patescibacteria group bacterium]|nr:CDP-glucose 4,6-dehydratase [Patescibacteria group bacterium]
MAIDKLQSFYRNKRVLVTGHTGFKGSWLCLWLKELGAELSGYSLPPNTNPNLYSILNLGIPETLADINNKQSLIKHFQEYQPEIVFHLAAQPLVRESYNDPIGTFQTNVAGIWNLLDAIDKTPSVKTIIVVTTDKCYRNQATGIPFVETDSMGGHDPYSASKACVEIICESWRSSFLSEYGKPSLATVRAGNVVGGGDWATDRLLSDCIKSFIAKQPIKLRYPNALRPWQHVLEALYGYMILAEKLYSFGDDFAEAWNFGPKVDNQATVNDIASMAAELWGIENMIEYQILNNFHEADLLRLDITKSTTRLDWAPQWDIRQTLVETVDWYKKWHQGSDMVEHSLSQIKRYTIN